MAVFHPKFVVEGDIITFKTKSVFYTGRIVANDNGIAVHLTSSFNLSDDKKLALECRMRNWYYYTHVQKKPQ